MCVFEMVPEEDDTHIHSLLITKPGIVEGLRVEEGQHPTETSRTSPGNSKRRKIVRSERITAMTTSASSSLWVH